MPNVSAKECVLVQRIRDNFGWNRALCDKSTKYATVVVYGKVTVLKIGGTPALLYEFSGSFEGNTYLHGHKDE